MPTYQMTLWVPNETTVPGDNLLAAALAALVTPGVVGNLKSEWFQEDLKMKIRVIFDRYDDENALATTRIVYDAVKTAAAQRVTVGLANLRTRERLRVFLTQAEKDVLKTILTQCPTCNVSGEDVYYAASHPTSCTWMMRTADRNNCCDELIKPGSTKCSDCGQPL